MATRTIEEAKVLTLAQEVAAEALRAVAEKVRAKRDSGKTWSEGGWYDDDADRARLRVLALQRRSAARKIY